MSVSEVPEKDSVISMYWSDENIEFYKNKRVTYLSLK